MKWRSTWLGLLVVIALAVITRGAGAQAPIGEERDLGTGAWAPISDWMRAEPPTTGGPRLEARGALPWWLAEREDSSGIEELAALLPSVPPPVSRETLDGEAEGLHRYTGLPGGIVLGLPARVPEELAASRLARNERGELGLWVDERFGGHFLRAPEIAPEHLQAFMRFVRAGLDGLIDLPSRYGTRPRLAPAFSGSGLEALLEEMDKTPHRVFPATRPYKTVILDRATAVVLRQDTFAFTADLEVRGYDDAGQTGWSRRALVIDALGADFVGPRRAEDLQAELAPLAEIAGWLGFLRWAEREDPLGFDALLSQ